MMFRKHRGEAASARALTVAIHDVAPATWMRCCRLLEMIDALVSLPVTLLVVPRYHGERSHPDFEQWLDQRVARGDELVLHGFTHRDEGVPEGWVDKVRRQWYTAGEGEFSGLSEEDAAARLQAGLLWFAAHGWVARGFVAPAWLMSAGTRNAVLAQGFAYTATLSRLIKLPSQDELPSQSIVFSTRAPWRRAVSLAWNAAVARAQADAPLLRVELHPTDVDHPEIRASWQQLLVDVSVDRLPLTVGDAVHHLPDAVWRHHR